MTFPKSKALLASGALLIVLSVGNPCLADDKAAVVDKLMESGGNAARFKNLRFEPSGKILSLPPISAPSGVQSGIAERAKELLAVNDGALTLLLLDEGRILFEGYKQPASATSAQHSMSMSKSLTAYLIGALLCDGKIKSLDDRADGYSPLLKGTVYGEATIKQLLTMSSGAHPATSAGNSYEGHFGDVRSGKVSSIAVMRKYGSRDIPSGKEFRYLGNDTQALGFVVDSTLGFGTAFQRYIWSQIGAEATGFWLLDKDDVAIAQGGASATTRDWGRLALWSLAQLKSPDTCKSDFMKAATTHQIENSARRVGEAFPSYGYQTWVRPNGGWATGARNSGARGVSVAGSGQRGESYWWVGYGGQRVGIDPRTGRILVLTSWREDYMGKVYSLFNDWMAAY